MTETVVSHADGDPGAYETLVLGIGNVLWADEGFGIRAVEALHARYSFPDDVRVMDGGTQGIFLLPWVTSARRLLIFDAVDFGMENFQPSCQRILKARFFQLQGFGYQRIGAHQFRIMAAHLAYQCRYQAIHDRLGTANLVKMAHRPAHNPAQHISPPFIGWQHAIGN